MENKKIADYKQGLTFERLYVSRQGEKEIANIEDCLEVSIQGLEDDIKKSKEILITTASNTASKRTNRKTTKAKKQNRKEKQLY